MARLDLRVRLLGTLMKATSVSGLDDEGLLKAQGRRLPRNALTRYLFGAVPDSVEWHDSTVDGHESKLPIRIYRPRDAARSGAPLPLVINYHGGGWTLGSLDNSDWLCAGVADAVGAVVVSVEYRLAPTHRWPAGPEDAYAALVGVVEMAAELGADPDRVAVMGDSAGANLSAVVCLMTRDRSGPALKHQVLIYPAVDLNFDSIASLEINAHAPILSTSDTLIFRDHYLGGQDANDPYMSPLFAENHGGLPPALIQVAEHDPIHDDGARYADALRAAGVEVRLTEYEGMPHGYISLPNICRAAPQALREICAELGAALSR